MSSSNTLSNPHWTGARSETSFHADGRKGNNVIILYAFTAAALLVSFIADMRKTIRGLEIALKRFLRIGPAFLTMLVLVSIALFVFPEETIARSLTSGSIWLATGIGTLIGSIAVMPGFIAFPLGSVLRNSGAPYMVVSGFTTTLMMVGILTFPMEKKYFGVRLALLRNLLAFLTALAVAFATGLYFGETGF